MPAKAAPETPAQLVALDLPGLETVIERLPAEQRERLARHFSPSAIRRRKLAERDSLLRLLAAGHPDAISGGELVRKLRSEIRTYASRHCPLDRAKVPQDQRLAMVHRVLVRAGGRAPSKSTIYRALAGLSQNQARK